MKTTLKTLSAVLMLCGLAACGSDTVVHERPVIVAPGAVSAPAPMTPDSVESNCAHGYDNSTHRCY